MMDLQGTSCDKPLVQGLERQGYIFNRSDISAIVSYGASMPNMIQQIQMKTGKKGFRVIVPARMPFQGTKTELSEGTYENGFTHTVSIVVLDAGADVSQKIIDPMANGEFVVVLENKFAGVHGIGVDNAFQVYGSENGLMATGLDREPWSDDTRGGWLITLQESEATRSGLYMLPTPPSGSINDATVETIRTYMESLVS